MTFRPRYLLYSSSLFRALASSSTMRIWGGLSLPLGVIRYYASSSAVRLGHQWAVVRLHPWS